MEASAISTIKEICNVQTGLPPPAPSSVTEGFPGLLGMSEPWNGEYPPKQAEKHLHAAAKAKGLGQGPWFWVHPPLFAPCPDGDAMPGRSFPATLPLVFMAPIKTKCALQSSFVYYKL